MSSAAHVLRIDGEVSSRGFHRCTVQIRRVRIASGHFCTAQRYSMGEECMGECMGAGMQLAPSPPHNGIGVTLSDQNLQFTCNRLSLMNCDCDCDSVWFLSRAGKRAHANKCGLQAPKRKEFRSRLSPSVYLWALRWLCTGKAGGVHF